MGRFRGEKNGGRLKVKGLKVSERHRFAGGARIVSTGEEEKVAKKKRKHKRKTRTLH